MSLGCLRTPKGIRKEPESQCVRSRAAWAGVREGAPQWEEQSKADPESTGLKDQDWKISPEVWLDGLVRKELAM